MSFGLCENRAIAQESRGSVRNVRFCQLDDSGMLASVARLPLSLVFGSAEHNKPAVCGT